MAYDQELADAYAALSKLERRNAALVEAGNAVNKYIPLLLSELARCDGRLSVVDEYAERPITNYLQHSDAALDAYGAWIDATEPDKGDS